MSLMKKQRILGTVFLIFAVLLFEMNVKGFFVIISGIFLGLGTALFFIPIFKKNSSNLSVGLPQFKFRKIRE